MQVLLEGGVGSQDTGGRVGRGETLQWVRQGKKGEGEGRRGPLLPPPSQAESGMMPTSPAPAVRIADAIDARAAHRLAL